MALWEKSELVCVFHLLHHNFNIPEVPWTSLLSHSTNLKIKDLQLTFQAQEMTLEENDIGLFSTFNMIRRSI